MNGVEAVVGFFRDVIVPIVIFVVLPVWFWFKRDRKKSEAETAVAERTVGVNVNAVEAAGLGQAVSFLQETFKAERDSMIRERVSLNKKVEQLEREREEDKAKITALEDAEEEKDRVISELRREIRALTERLSALEAVSPPTDPGMRAIRNGGRS